MTDHKITTENARAMQRKGAEANRRKHAERREATEARRVDAALSPRDRGRLLAAELWSSAADRLRESLERDDCASALRSYWQLVDQSYGAPVQTVAVARAEDLDQLTNAELNEALDAVSTQLALNPAADVDADG